jgi:glycosyltransferase involved in cell wall biosynthesis
MEIIHLILGKANPERMNGINRVVYQLATHQHNLGRKVSVWGITHDLTRNFGDRPFATELFPASWHPFGVSKALRAALRLMQGRRDVVFHLHGGWVPVYATLSGILHRCGLPFVITGHGAYNAVAMQRSKWQKTLYFSLFEKRVLDRALRVHSIGRSEVEGLQSFYPNQKSMLLPYGFEPSATLPQTANKESGFVIGFVGRLDTWTKGLDLLIKAYQTIRQTHAETQLWIVGDGAGRDFLETYITEHKIEGVILWGSTFGKEKDALMACMNVFAHPSRNEGLPASVLEAAAMEIPVVVSIPTNVAEAVQRFDAGHVLPENTSDELISALELVLRSTQDTKQQLGENARRMIDEAFCWANLVPQYDSLYYHAD